jgi:N-acyl-D-amino-acid deacylase
MQFDCIIQNGSIVDGSGRHPPFRADIAVQDDRIVAVGPLDGAQADTTIDAQNRVVCPGFIDVHVHSEIALLGLGNERTRDEDQLAGVRQGITTHLISPDGFGWAALSPQAAREMWEYTQFAYGEADLALNWPSVQDYLALFEGRTPINVYPQIPHGSVRLQAMGWEPRPANDRELAAMTRSVHQWMDAGAGSICLGLDYQPGANASLKELVVLSRTVAQLGGIYAAHTRNQALGRTGAWQETLEVSRQAHIPVHISHERVDREAEQLLDAIEREGLDLTFESYLYPAGMTHMALYLSPEIKAGSLDDMLRRMRDPLVRETSIAHLQTKLGSVGDQIVGNTGSGRYVGLTLAQAAQGTGQTWAEFVYDLILSEEGLECFIMPWAITGQEREDVLRRTALHPRAMIASDGIYGIPHPHPRGHGCFVQVLRRYVRELGLLSLQEAIYKMSGMPAQRFGLSDRGQIAVGKAADLVIFDPNTVADRSTWQKPRLAPVGVDRVMVNGEWVVIDGVPTGKLPGRVLRRSNSTLN